MMAETYTLMVGTKRYSSWSLRPWLLMKMAGVPFQEIVLELDYVRRLRVQAGLPPIDATNRIPDFSPSGRVPALKIDAEGGAFAVWDSLAICETLAERHPEKHLWPPEARARAEARAVAAEMHSGFPDLRRVLPMDFGHTLPTPELDESTQKQIARVVEIWQSALSRFASSGGFLFGGFSIADAFYAPVVSRFETYRIALPAASQAYCERMRTLAPMQEWRAASMKES